MRIGTIKVREALNSSITVTDAQIQESLWHYYYDIGKTVTYLKSKYLVQTEAQFLTPPLDKFAPAQTKATPEPKKAKTLSRFEQAASAVAPETKNTAGKQTVFQSHLNTIFATSCTALQSETKAFAKAFKTMAEQSCPRISASKGSADTLPSPFPVPAVMDSFPVSARDFFWDTPWGNLPSNRLGEITVEPLLPRGRLLGGSSKPSKLAALAAARKKKQEEVKTGSSAISQSVEAKETDKAVSLLDRLSVRSRENATPFSIEPKDQETGRKQVLGRYPARKRPSSPEATIPEPQEPEVPKQTSPAMDLPNLRTAPSTFASTLCGIDESPNKKQHMESRSLPLPLISLHGNPFAGPSPDDIVLRAQAKGAVHG